MTDLYAYYLELMRDRYFPAVMTGDYARIESCFTGDAHILIYNGDNAIQRFDRNPANGLRPFTEFYGHLFDNYSSIFDNFTWVCDEKAHTGAAIFTPHLTPLPGSYTEPYGELHLNNANFFWFKNNLIEKMVIYYANPNRNAAYDGPTPFPRDGVKNC